MNKFYRLSGILFVLILNIGLSGGQNKSEIKILAGVPSLFINNQPYSPFAYMSYLGEKKYYKEISAAGIHLYCFPAYLGDRGINTNSGIGPFRTPVWIGENQYDFTSITEDFEKIIESDSAAKIIVRFYLDPPAWWEKLNPDACCQLPDGSTFRQCFASSKWREETGRVLKYCLEWLIKSKYSEYLVGMHIAAGSTEEWFYHSKQYDDINPVRLETFRKWLSNRYNNINSLQKAWNNKSINFKTACFADISGNNRKTEWRNAEKEQNYIDTYRFHSELLVNNIEYFCRIVKETSNQNLLTGVFYGYHFYVTEPRSGHGALYKLLECPCVDYLSSPNTYNRVIGEDWPPMVAIQSVQLHKKLWLAENDTRTSITTLLKDRSKEIAPPGQYESGVWLGPEDMETSVAFLWKNTGRMLTHGYGGWWFDMWGGWFSDPCLLNILKKTQQLYALYPPQNTKKTKSEVCIVVDEELCFYDASYGKLTEQILSNRYPLAKTGAPYDLFLRTDLNVISTDNYKVIWFMGFPELRKKEIAMLRNLQGKGITILLTDKEGTKIFNNNNEKIFIKEKYKWTDSQLREIWKSAGIHLYIDTGDVFYIGNNWICIHTVTGGKKTIKLPNYCQIIDPLVNKTLADSAKTIDINLAPKSTSILRINVESAPITPFSQFIENRVFSESDRFIGNITVKINSIVK